MNQGGLSIYSTVSDVVHGASWEWPIAWRNVFLILFRLRLVHLNPSKTDVIKWRKEDGNLEEFSTSLAWDALRNHEIVPPWNNLSPFSIPRHAFLMWLVFRRKLSTQDRIQEWNWASGSMDLMCCLLCKRDMDSHSHLFFECSYSNQIWCSVRKKVGMNHIQGKWEDIVTWLIPILSSKSAHIVAAKLVLVASAYYIWQERNARFLKNQLRTPEKVEEIIVETVRLKLQEWKITSQDVFIDD
ncbi:putative reverse transcriptase zinc-binding domain-containing protein [Helianthus annuus]|uniref:uncharacterized protein LOC110870587 n=1 Tax=Helianthus annuus TaxID=4232 RepID=UPI000B8F55C6|nr:uncharacterized protein LOC110870587 [Helianthus annuus]KAJ0548500.1 putative reverse transcriptase zinc-binding domain-containing protein [Helianthus annuus]